MAMKDGSIPTPLVNLEYCGSNTAHGVFRPKNSGRMHYRAVKHSRSVSY